MGAAVAKAGAAALGGVGKFLSIRGEYQAGLADEAQLRTNRRLAELEAQDALARGEKDAERVRAEGRQVIGQAKAALGASGAVANSGSALDALVDTARFTEADAQQVRANAMREAWGHRVQGAQYGYAETVARKRRQAALAGGVLSGIGELVTGGMMPGGGK